MAERTPTTDDVRARYIDSRAGIGQWTRWDESVGRDVEAANAEFDRWLAEVRREAAEKAWDEGYKAGCHDSAENEQRFQMRDWWSDPLTTPNPYRKETDRAR